MTVILVVDDDPLIRELLVLLLAGHGHSVHGSSGLSDLQGAPRPDLLVTDMHLGDAVGPEVLAHLCATGRRPAHAVLLSAVDVLPEGAADGFDAALTKPLDLSELADELLAMLG